VNIPFLDVGASYRELRDELDAAYARVMRSGRYVLGDEVAAFEAEFAALCQTRRAVGVGNGLGALSIALRACGIGAGDEVIVPAHTFVATWLAVVQAGAKIVPVDVDPQTLLLDTDASIAAVTPRTAAIVAVHLYGQPVDLDALAVTCSRRALLLIGDAAQAHGAARAGRSVGALGDVAAFSFYPAKNLGAFGDGGALTTNDEALARRATRIRNYGGDDHNDWQELGANSRLDPLQAAFLRVKLRALSRWNARRRTIAGRYLSELAGVPGLTLPKSPGREESPSWHLFCIRHDERDRLARYLTSRGIETRVHYPLPPHRSPAFEHLGFTKGAFPVAEAAAERILSLPIGPHMDDVSVGAVVDAVASYEPAARSRQ
jgi:dTDP-3-amino-3,4,6-trideoxy-alpha-D-glucose transaminase